MLVWFVSALVSFTSCITGFFFLVFFFTFVSRSMFTGTHYIGCSSPDLLGAKLDRLFWSICVSCKSHHLNGSHTHNRRTNLIAFFALANRHFTENFDTDVCAYREMSWKHSSFTSTLWHRITRSSYLQPTIKKTTTTTKTSKPTKQTAYSDTLNVSMCDDSRRALVRTPILNYRYEVFYVRLWASECSQMSNME